MSYNLIFCCQPSQYIDFETQVPYPLSNNLSSGSRHLRIYLIPHNYESKLLLISNLMVLHSNYTTFLYILDKCCLFCSSVTFGALWEMLSNKERVTSPGQLLSEQMIYSIDWVARGLGAPGGREGPGREGEPG